MLGYLLTALIAAIGALSFAYMDLDSSSDFQSMFLPFAFVLCALLCLIAVTSWIMWHLGAGPGADSSGGWLPWGSGSWWPSSTGTGDRERPAPDSGSGDSGADGGGAGGGD